MRVEIDYTNWRGERRLRVVMPMVYDAPQGNPTSLWYGATEWHPQDQWLLRALEEGGKVRDFAMSGIHSWRNL